MRIAVELDVVGHQVEHLHVVVDQLLLAIDHPQTVGRDDGQFVIGQVDDPIGMSGQRRGVAGDPMLARSDAHDQRTGMAGGDDDVGIVAKQDRQSVGPLKLRQRRADGADQRLVIVFGKRGPEPGRPLAVAIAAGGFFLQTTGDQVGDDFGVGGRMELIALGQQPVFQRAEVFDHAVVNHGDRAISAEMGMGVAIGGRSMRGPAGVAHADFARDRMPPELFDQSVDAAGTFGDLQPAAADGGDARAVIAAVFQSPQSLDQKIDGITPADITHDSTHAGGFSYWRLRGDSRLKAIGQR